jgi:hypothetical protein
MMFEAKLFEKHSPAIFREILQEIWAFGFTPTVIGGAVRDFLLSGVTGDDWDIELSHPTLAFDKGHWKDLGQKLSRFGKINHLPFDIIRLESHKMHFEFSPPRKEVFFPDWQNHGHKNFSVELNFRLDSAQAAARRDFTINTIGLRFLKDSTPEIIDPLNGVRHLQDKILHPAGEDFEKDPIRFLRSYRFRLKLGFQFSPELTRILKAMPLGPLSAHYFWEEMKKSRHPVEFYREILLSGRDLNLPLKEDVLPQFPLIKSVLKDPSVHENWVLALELAHIDAEPWQKFFNVGSDSMRRLSRWARSTRQFEKILPEEFQGEFEVVRTLPSFDLLHDWYFTTKQLLVKNPKLPLLGLMETLIPGWSYLFKFEPMKDLGTVEPPLRSRYQLWNLCQRL